MISRSPLFQEIVDNDKAIEEGYYSPVLYFDRMVRLLQRKRQLIKAAERALNWNKDKGNG
jgi:hypothetical protein